MNMNIYVFDLITLYLGKCYQLLGFEILPLEKKILLKTFIVMIDSK